MEEERHAMKALHNPAIETPETGVYLRNAGKRCAESRNAAPGNPGAVCYTPRWSRKPNAMPTPGEPLGGNPQESRPCKTATDRP